MTKSRRFFFTSVGGIEITLGPVWLSALQWCLSIENQSFYEALIELIKTFPYPTQLKACFRYQNNQLTKHAE